MLKVPDVQLKKLNILEIRCTNHVMGRLSRNRNSQFMNALFKYALGK